MKALPKLTLSILTLCSLLLLSIGQVNAADNVAMNTDNNPRVRLVTTMGDIVLELNREKAPKSVENFLVYVNEGFYDGTIFHRIIDGFMAQGGGFTPDFQKKPVHSPVDNEADNGLKNLNGTVAMARTNAPHSATAQFFINVADNAFLDHRSPTPRGWGYAVFGKVVEGMDIVDKIRKTPTAKGGPFRTDVPRTAIIIERAILEGAMASADTGSSMMNAPAISTP